MNNVPQKPGLYWAKPEIHDETWAMIARVSGKAPFLKVVVWYVRGNVIGIVNEDDVDKMVWGPQILHPNEVTTRLGPDGDKAV